MLQLGTWRSSRPLRYAPSVTAAPDAAWARRRDPVLAQDVGIHVLVLRTLIEEFGGETTSAELCRRLAATKPASPGCNQTQSRGWIGVTLDDLASCGALDLEWLHGTEAILRVTLDGVILAYQQPVADVAFGTARAALSARTAHD